MTRALTGGLPELYTAAIVAAHIGCNERRLRKIARSLGACREIGKTMVFTDDDVRAILEATRLCPSNSTDAAKSGITGAPLPAGDYEALRAQRTKPPPSESQRTSKRGRVNVTYMDPRRS
jgi:hypothetical protein